MKNSNIIDKLLRDEKWPALNSITFSDGKMTLMDIRIYNVNDYYINPIADTTINSFLKYNKDDLSPFDAYSTLQAGKYEINVGSAALEQEGVIYVTDVQDKHLEWFYFFEDSNQFKSVTVNEVGEIHAITEGNITWVIPITDPLNLSIFYPEN